MNKLLSSLFFTFLLASSGGILLADEIPYKDSDDDPLDVEIRNINYKKISYVLPGMDEAPQEMDVSKVDVEKIVFTVVPGDFESARNFHGQGNYRSAIEAYRRAMSDRTRNGWVDQYALYYIAECHLAQGNAAEANAAYQELLTKFPETIHFAASHLDQAKLLLLLGQVGEARKTLQSLVTKVSEADLDDVWGFQAKLLLYEIEERSGEIEKARKNFQQLADQTKTLSKATHYRAKLGLARCTWADPAKKEGARELFEELVQAGLRHEIDDQVVLAGAYNGMAACHFEAGEYKPCLLAAIHVVLMYPEEEALPEALFRAASTFHLLGNPENGWKDRARSLFDRLQSEFPDSQWAKEPRPR